MSKVIRSIAPIVGFALGTLIGGPLGGAIGAGIFSIGASLIFKPSAPKRAATAVQLQLGEQPRQAILGRAATGGSLVDAFNYGGKYGTDWEVLVIALADHRCDALEGFFVDDTYVAFTGDGIVAGFNSQLQVFFRDGRWDQAVPSILTTNGPGWTANDRGRGVAYVVVAYKADASDAKNPVYPSGRPRFRWVLRGLRCYQARKDSTVGGSGAHRWNDPATWQWTENPIDIRHNWVRGIYAGDRNNQPEMLLVGRGLSATEAPPANVFARANLCDEVVDGQPRYRIGGIVASTEPFIEIEQDFAVAVAGTISQPEGAVEVDPGQAKAVVATITDDDLLVGSKVIWNEGILGAGDGEWINTVAARFVDPAQRWAVRGAPVRRETADVLADGGPREAQPQLDLVTNQPQAQRIAEIIRRLGRLWGRAQVTLPPRFAFIEEGDWIAWQSARRFGGATRTFRVEAWGSDRAWHHQLTLRQISASVFSDTAPLSDGVTASTQSAPPVVAAPAVGAWNAAAVLLGSGSVRVPNLRVAGTPDDPAADFVVIEYVPQVAAPDAGTIWTFASSSRPDVRLLDIPVIEGGTYWVAVSYVVDGIQGARRVLGPISTSGLAFSDGTPVAPVAPANANRVPFSRMEGNRGWTTGFTSAASSTGPVQAVGSGRYFISATATFSAAGQAHIILNNPRFPVIPGERLSVQSRVDVLPISGPSPASWQLTIQYFQGNTILRSDVIASGVGNAPSAVFSANPLATFSTVPAGAETAWIFLSCTSAGAGTMAIALLEPMVTSAAPGQTIHPPFSPGPNSEDGANLTSPANANRVPFSRMEGDRAWAALFNPSGLSGSTGYGAFENRRFFVASPAATASGQTFSIGGVVPLRVSAGERLSVQAKLDVGLTPAIGGSWTFRAVFRNAAGAATFVNVASGAGGIAAPAVTSGFIDVPAGQVSMTLELVAVSGGAGTWQIAISEPMVTSAAPGQSLHPSFSPGPNASDGADPNNLITIVGGIISGIGTANIFVDNTRAGLQGLASARPASGQFIGQEYHATDAREIFQWDGFNWRSSADITALAQRSIVPQFPIIEIRQGEAGHTGTRIVTHTAKRGTSTIGGGTWSIVAQSLGAGSASVNGSTGAVTLSGIVQSGSYTIRYTHTDGVQTDVVVNVTYIPSATTNPAFASGAIANFANSSFVPVTSDLSVVLPSGVTSVTLTAANVDLLLLAQGPSPAFVSVEMKWLRESSPGTWSDVGAVATSSPDPSVTSPEGFFESNPGEITCNRSATGLSAGSTQKFRLVARISAGPVRTVIASGTASASA